MLDDDEDFDISYSDDGLKIELPSFLLQIYETDGELSNDSTYKNLQNACDSFLLAELNAIYSPQHAVDEVNSTVYTDDRVVMDGSTRRLLPEEQKRDPSRRELMEWEENYASIESAEDERRFLRGKHNLTEIVGSEMLMRVNITFGSRPTPSDELVRKKVQDIMKNLGNLVNNLTSTDDPELRRVYIAIRREIQTFLPSFSPSEHQSKQPSLSPLNSNAPFTSYAPAESYPPTNNIPSPGNAVIKNPDGSVITLPKKQNVLMISVVTGITITTFLALGSLLIFRSRRRDDDSEKGIFEEFDEAPSPQDGLSQGYDTRSVTEDSIFSGLTDILTDAGSPKVRANKSMSSATTVKATNQRQNFKSPSSMAASTLFAFSEEDEDNISHSDTDHTGDETNECTPLSPNGIDPSSASMKSSAILGSRTGISASSKRRDLAEIKSNNSAQFEEEYCSQLNLSPDMDENQPYDLGPIVTDVKSMVLAGGILTGTGVTATSTEQKKFIVNINSNKKATLTSSKSGISERSTDGAFPSDNAEKEKQADCLYYDDPDEECSPLRGEGKKQVISLFLSEEGSPETAVFSPSSGSSRMSCLSGMTTPESRESKGSEVSASRQLINDLVWLEKKIADVRSSTAGSSYTGAIPTSPSLPELHAADSLSYKSMDASVSPSSHGDTTIGSNGLLQNIICRDCFAPPGKLQIIIHSTKDGPAVHTVKERSSLKGHIFPGDLIIALDNVDTRTFTAEQVMKAMAAKCGFERKITVLHYEE